ncbi:MAG: HesA/MoeB/ThiF family protein [Lentisphaeraceae bacterium]|nr:HesA/MoeB/ThiF family protein [Lentisphaeraceae bacterium]
MKKLTDEEKETYSWQTTVPGFGEEGQEILKNSTVMISRCGGLGSVVAYELAAAGIGRMVLAHGGDIKHSDLNRQLLMTHDALGTPRIESVEKRLKELNPRLEIVAVNSNVCEDNVAELVAQSDLIVDCAPLFNERYLMNREAVRQNKPMVECAMFELQAQITTIIPGETPCLSCIYPEDPSGWKRRFPVFGAVSGTVGCMAAMEAIKVLSKLGSPLKNQLLSFDLRDMSFLKMPIVRKSDCPVCSSN